MRAAGCGCCSCSGCRATGPGRAEVPRRARSREVLRRPGLHAPRAAAACGRRAARPQSDASAPAQPIDWSFPGVLTNTAMTVSQVEDATYSCDVIIAQFLRHAREPTHACTLWATQPVPHWLACAELTRPTSVEIGKKICFRVRSQPHCSEESSHAHHEHTAQPGPLPCCAQQVSACAPSHRSLCCATAATPAASGEA